MVRCRSSRALAQSRRGGPAKQQDAQSQGGSSSRGRWREPVRRFRSWREHWRRERSCSTRKPIAELVIECQNFIARSGKRLAKVKEERVSENALLEEGGARLARLETQAAVSVPLPFAAPLAATSSELEAEVSRLREELATLEHPCRPPTSEEAFARGFCHQYRRRGSIVDEMPTIRNGGSSFVGSRGGCFQVGSRDCGGCSRVAAMDSATFMCCEHSELRVFDSRGLRIRVGGSSEKIVFHQCGFRGCRVGEVSNPGKVQTRQTSRLHVDNLLGATHIDASSEEEPAIPTE